MKTFSEGSTFQVRSLDGPQKLGIFYEGVEIESKTSAIGLIFVKIQFHTKVYARNKNRKGR